jgi:soluble lytic murein transglycosylase-like protein
MPSREAFLSDPGLTIDLGARWFRKELLDRHEGNILLAVMEHNAGYPAVKDWIETWETAGRYGDVEYMIETAGFSETRIFTRSVLTDMAVAQAIGLFAAVDNLPHQD